jgi:transposase-like protein
MARIAPPLQKHKHYEAILRRLVAGDPIPPISKQYDVPDSTLYAWRSKIRRGVVDSLGQKAPKPVKTEDIPAKAIQPAGRGGPMPSSTEPELERLRRELSTLYKAAAGQGDVRIANQVARTQLDALKLRASLRGELQAPSSQSTVVVLIPSKLRERGMRTVGRASVQAVPDSDAPVVEIEADPVEE